MKKYKGYILLAIVTVFFNLNVSAQKTKAALKDFIETRAELLKGKDFWKNDTTSLETFIKVDSMVHNLFVHATFHPKTTSWRTVEMEGVKLLLTKYDFTKDDIPDEFAYAFPNGIKTQEFGVMFDLNKDNKLDYIVYNGGVAMSHDAEFYFYFYHMIDTNYDGLIDTYVMSVANQPNQDLPDPHKILWISDIDGDKKAEVFKFVDIRSGETVPVETDQGIWRCNTFFGENELSPEDSTFFDAFTNLLTDLNRF